MAGRLKPLDVERETRPGKYADGDGLYLIVAGPTSRNWTYRYWTDGKERWLRPRLAQGSCRSRMRDLLAMQRDSASKAIAARPASTSCRRSERRVRRAKVAEIKVERCRHSNNAPKLTSRELVDLEQEAPQSMAIFAQALCLSDDRQAHDRRRSSRAIFTICSRRSGLRSARRRTVSAAGSKRSSRKTSTLTTTISQSRRTHQTTARKASEAAQARRAASPALPYAEASQFMGELSGAGPRSDAALPDLHGVPDERGGRRPVDRNRSILDDLEDPGRAHEDGRGPRRALSQPALDILDEMSKGAKAS